MSNVRRLPEPDFEGSPLSVELISIWIVKKIPNIAITDSLTKDPAQWGIILADVIRHLGRAYSLTGMDGTNAVERIKAGFDAEWDHPTI